MSEDTTIQTLNGVVVVQRADGKYGLVDLIAGTPAAYRWRSLDLALQVAREVAAENDRIDRYEAKHSAPDAPA